MSTIGFIARLPITSIPASALFYNPLMHKSEASANFCIMPARPLHHTKITALYNRWIPEASAGMRITEDHVAMRLERDPHSVLVGFFAPDFENPVSLINVVKLAMDTSTHAFSRHIPKSHQELTGNDTFSTTDPKGNVWFCPWVVMHDRAFGYALKWRDVFRNAARLHVLTVANLAIQSGFATRVFAYSRPIDLKRTVEKMLGTKLTHNVIDGVQQIFANGKRLGKDTKGIYRRHDNGKKEYIVKLSSLLREEGGLKDTGFRLHKCNGGQFLPDMVFPDGHVYDTQSLGFGTCFEYDLGDLKSFIEETPLPFRT
ncbi:MAG: hypothetical protein ABH871_07935 [Pseudomonadota bacterium]